MRIHAYELSPSGELTKTTRSLTEVARDTSKLHWVNVADYGPDELEHLLAPLGFTPLELQACLTHPSGARVLPLANSLFLELPFEAEQNRVGILSCLCRPHLLLVIHVEVPEYHDHLLATVLQRLSANDGTTAGLLGRLVAYMSGESLRRARDVRQQGIDLEEKLEEDGADVDPGTILQLKQTVRLLTAIVEDQAEVVGLLKGANVPGLDRTIPDDLGQLSITSLSTAERTIDRTGARVHDIQSHYELQQQERTNRRLGMLTVISSIFMPLTFIAGIYGMNFENMPELSGANSYFIALGAMLTLGLGLFLFFWLRGWFD